MVELPTAPAAPPAQRSRPHPAAPAGPPVAASVGPVPTGAPVAGAALESAPPDGAPELDVSIIVPISAAAAEIEEVVAALGGELDREGKSWECILVFDGIRGRGYAEAQALAQVLGPKLKTILFKHHFGESVCLSAGLERARGRVIVTSPQYVQIDPLELSAMLAALDGGADLVTPWRKPRIDPWLNQLQSSCFNWVIRQIIRMDFHDLNCHLRAIRREVLGEVAVYGDMYRFLPVIAHRQGFVVVEVPVRHIKEWGSAGFFGLGVYVRRFLDVLGVMFLTKFTLKPLRFFGTVGALCGGLGGVMLTIITFQKFLQGQGLYGRPVFLIALMLIVLGAQIIGFGLVGEIIIYTQARHLREYRVERVYESLDEQSD
jgi:glycosyltransferase involved in cell wall biosynthesis